MALSDAEVTSILKKYVTDQKLSAETSYATVRDFCDSADNLPQLTGLDGDLKNVQRPWAVKTLMRCCPPPATLLEIGGGEPRVSDFLTQLGYEVTLVDPYDGSGHGPTEYEAYCKLFPNVRIIRDHFRADMPSLGGEKFDAIFSISVIEHFSPELIVSCLEAVRESLRPGGASIHCFDFILQGIGEAHDRPNAQLILDAQARLSGLTATQLQPLLDQLQADLDTFYLSPQGHHLWRGRRSYDEFPFRKVISLQTVARRAA